MSAFSLGVLFVHNPDLYMKQFHLVPATALCALPNSPSGQPGSQIMQANYTINWTPALSMGLENMAKLLFTAMCPLKTLTTDVVRYNADNLIIIQQMGTRCQ